MPEFDFDVAVIGGGSAGYAAANRLAAAGRKVAVIDGARELGGLCILRGCMPTKALLHAAELSHAVQAGAEWGLTLEGEPNSRGEPTRGRLAVNFRRLMARKNELIADFAKYRQDQLSRGRWALIRARARFSDAHTVVLEPTTATASGRLTAAHFIVTTGSTIKPPPFRGLSARPVLDSDTVLSLDRLPTDLCVLGAGAVGCEYAQFFARLGVPVTLVQRSAQLLRNFDADVAEELAKAFVREGISVYRSATIEQLGPMMGRLELQLRLPGLDRPKELHFKNVFNALGRQPATDGLDLEKAAVARLPSGHIQTDLHQRTTAPHIFAAGDCSSQFELVHLAIIQGETAAQTILNPGTAAPMDYRLLTTIVFTDPQVACVGLTEKSAQAQQIPYLTAKYPFNDHGKSMILGAREGFVKLLAAPDTGEILGAAAVGPQGGEIIHEIIVAMAKRMTVRELAAIPHYHPTLAEIWTYPAEELADQIAASSGRP